MKNQLKELKITHILCAAKDLIPLYPNVFQFLVKLISNRNSLIYNYQLLIVWMKIFVNIFQWLANSLNQHSNSMEES